MREGAWHCSDIQVSYRPGFYFNGMHNLKENLMAPEKKNIEGTMVIWTKGF